MKFVFVADFFANQIVGGGELNNDELIKLLSNTGHEVETINSHLVTLSFLKERQNYNFIISNFVGLPPETKDDLLKNKYVIYEHDHKYLLSRNPAEHKDYLAPEEEIINYEFYESAKAVFCQTNFHKNIVEKNLKLDNIVSVGGNLWSTEQLDLFSELGQKDKIDACAIMNSPILHKGTQDAVLYCKSLGLEYVLVDPKPPHEFLKELGGYKSLVFFPKTPETLSRIVVEARMMGMQTRTTKNIGAIHEEWFSKKGEDLVSIMREKRNTIPTMIVEAFK